MTTIACSPTKRVFPSVQCRNQCHGAIVATNESASMTEQGSGWIIPSRSQGSFPMVIVKNPYSGYIFSPTLLS
jgi:hypothetical protein